MLVPAGFLQAASARHARYNVVVLRRALAIAILVALTTGQARANGRFPEAQAIETSGDAVYLRTTFGLLVSRDRGRTWHWICERALGFEGSWDPPIATTRDGRLWVGLEDGLVRTADGCHFEREPLLEGATTKDLAADGDALWAITGRPGERSHVWRIEPDHVERRAGLDANLLTIEGSAKDVYLTGQPYASTKGQIFRSTDEGRTFARPSSYEGQGPLFLGAVDGQRLFVREISSGASSLLVSADAGRSFRMAVATRSSMYGFAKHGHDVWVGAGVPEQGVHVSTDDGERFRPFAWQGVLCLHASADGDLYACQNAFTLGTPAIAVARGGGKLEPLARFSDVKGPVACHEAVCGPAWPALAAKFEVAEAGADATPPDATPPARRTRCTCDFAPGEPLSPWLLALGVAIARRLRAPRDGAARSRRRARS